jgi:hypothetical protein
MTGEGEIGRPKPLTFLYKRKGDCLWLQNYLKKLARSC